MRFYSFDSSMLKNVSDMFVLEQECYKNISGPFSLPYDSLWGTAPISYQKTVFCLSPLKCAFLWMICSTKHNGTQRLYKALKAFYMYQLVKLCVADK